MEKITTPMNPKIKPTDSLRPWIALLLSVMIHDNAARRVVTHLDTIIAQGDVGDRLPSVRTLMTELGVSPATVRAAVSELVRADRIETISGSGTFILAEPRPQSDDGDRGWQTAALSPHHLDIDFPGPLQSTAPPDTIDLASGYPDATLQPIALLTKAMRDAARRPGTYGRAPGEGLEPLRSWFATELHPRGQHDVLITSGGQSALSLIFRSIALPGDTVAMETPTYIGAIAACRAAGLTPAAVTADDSGIRVDQLEAVIEATGARLVYLQPRFHNPTGAHLLAERRQPLMELAAERGLILIEDDWLHDLDDPATRSRPLASNDPNGHVIHIRSLSKSVAPAMRIAGIASQGVIAERLKAMRTVEDFFVSPILQETALNVVTSTGWARHLRAMRLELRTRQAALRDAIAATDCSESNPVGGPLHLWLRLPPHLDALAVRDAALRRGVSIIAGNQWHPSDPRSTHIRLSNASAPVTQIVEGVRRLGSALDAVRLGPPAFRNVSTVIEDVC